MNMNLINLVRDQFGNTAKTHLGSLLGQNPDNLASGIDDSIGAVLDGFSNVARDADGREVLYEAVRYCDESVVDNPAVMFENRDAREVFTESHQRLAGLVGTDTKDNMVREIQSSSDLSQTDAENMLGYVTPGATSCSSRSLWPARPTALSRSPTPAGSEPRTTSRTRTVSGD